MTSHRLPLLLAVLAAAVAARADPAPASPPGDPGFAVHDGDRVVFYGDSITQAGGYGFLVEEYARTRFPKQHFNFYNAGVGGDRVDGGGAGDIRVRLQRDLFALHPTVVTIMLGMNDGSYRAADPAVRRHFADGYRAIVEQIEQAFPAARIYPILPSPFDDIARPPQFDPGYDHVLRELGLEVSQIAADHHLQTVDFGRPLNEGLARVLAQDPALARLLLPDRVHPTPAGHLVLGAALLRAWHAPSLVSGVEIEAGNAPGARTTRAAVDHLQANGTGVSWNELEEALPLPVNFDDASVGLAQLAGARLDELDQELLSIKGLPPGRYALRIDDHEVVTLSAEEWAKGINLGTFNTPMRGQAFQVVWGTEGGHDRELVRRDLMAHGPQTSAAAATAAQLAAWDDADQASRSKQPAPHHFAVTRAP